MTERRFNYDPRTSDPRLWEAFVVATLGSPVLRDIIGLQAPGTTVEDAVANFADSVVFSWRQRFEADPQPTAFVLEAPELDEPPLTPRSEQREVIAAEKARIDEALSGNGDLEALAKQGEILRSWIGPRSTDAVADDLQPEPAPVPEVEP
jgi:hypothetical protein